MKSIKYILSGLLLGWKKFSHVLGWVNSRIIFSIIYLVLFGVYNAVMRLIAVVGRQKKSETFWVDKKYTEPTVSMQRQF